MKFCLRYRKAHSALMDKADELSIIYNKRDTTLLEFLKKYQNKRINIKIEDLDLFKKENELKKFIAIRTEYPEINFCLQLPKYDLEFIEELKSTDIKFFINIFANNWDTFQGLIEAGVCDIYIVENLGFELDLCAEQAHSRNINIRVFPNVAQSQWKDTPGIKKFFIRPEDIDIYSKYIDTIEFLGDADKENVYYEVYAETKEWFGPLKEIISGLDSDIDSRYIIPRFAESRVNCGKRCFKNGRCNICESIDKLSNTLKDRGIIVTNTQSINEEIVDNNKNL